MSRRRFKSRIRQRFHWFFWGMVLLAALAILLLRLTLFHTLRIEGVSMESTLSGGDIVLVLRMNGAPERGDIIQCRFPGRSGTYVKRVIGLPGEYIELRGGATYVNGAPISEPYLSSAAEDYSIQLGADEYFLLGDNRAESYDSREADMGPVSHEDCIGRVVLGLWPLQSIN